jgi:hypothetical protein
MDQDEKKPEKQLGGVTGKGFKPGVSGNPNGRPRTAKFNEAARLVLAEIETASGDSNAELLVKHCLKKAMRGSVRHAELLLAYAEGRPKQGVELSGSLQFQNMREDELDKRLTELLEKYQQDKQRRERGI